MLLRTKSVQALAATALIGAAVLTACGGSDSSSGASPSASDSQTAATNGLENKSADQILAATKQALGKATSVHMTGSLGSSNGGAQVDMSLTTDGGGAATGTITSSGQQVTLLAVDNQVYLSADATFWAAQKMPQTIIDQVDGKYVQVPAKDQSFSSITDLSSMLDQLAAPQGNVTKGDQTTVNDIPVIQLIDGKDQGVLSISLVSDPLPVSATSSDQGEVQFSSWNEPVTVTAPAADDIVDLSSLMGG